MRVTSLTTSDAIIRQISQLSSQQANLQTEVSTGQKITNPEDDPAETGDHPREGEGLRRRKGRPVR